MVQFVVVTAVKGPAAAEAPGNCSLTVETEASLIKVCVQVFFILNDHLNHKQPFHFVLFTLMN